jgi:hypothetical protein
MVIDSHVHVAVKGDHPEFREFGKIGVQITSGNRLAYAIMLKYAGVDGADTDENIEKAILTTIAGIKEVDKVVCLALDPIYGRDGIRNTDETALWVANEYVLKLRSQLPSKILFGASVHPYDPEFERRVDKYVEQGAVLIKWLPSSQLINLADPIIAERLRFLATAKNGRPLPLLVHIGPEHAIPTPDRRARSYDYIQWSKADKFWNSLRFGASKLYVPDVTSINQNFNTGLDAGAVIIFAHCGLPYYEPKFSGLSKEHSDFDAIRRWLRSNDEYPNRAGKCYADVSACMTPIRRAFFDDIMGMPDEYLLLGSDFPVPVFELSAGKEENWRDLRAILRGEWERIVIPQDNLIDVNLRESKSAFGHDHKLFTNFAERLL